jgi:hypothetical protein
MENVVSIAILFVGGLAGLAGALYLHHWLTTGGMSGKL